MYNEERVFDVSASDMLNIQHSTFIIHHSSLFCFHLQSKVKKRKSLGNIVQEHRKIV